MQIKEINVSRSVCFNIGQQYSNEVLVIHFKGLPDLPNKYIYVKKDNYEKEVHLVGDLYVVSRPLTTYSGEVNAQIIARDPGSTPIALTPNFKMMITPSNYSGIGEDENYPDDPNIKNYFVKIDEKVNSFEELANLVQTKLDNGEFVGAQGPKGENGDPGEKGDPGDVTEEFKNLASQIAQNASDAQSSATNAQVSATNAQKALDDTKEFVNQTKTELNQIKTDTSALKDEANTSAVNAKASETKAKEYADNLKESTDAISKNTKAISELADKKITKFYASNQGEIHLADSDNGKIQDMMIYGKSNQNQTKGKNLLKYPYIEKNKQSMGITFTDNKDGSINVSGTGTGTTYYNFYLNSDGKRLTLASGTYKLVAKGRSKCNVFINNGVNSAKNEETFTITDGHNDVWCFIEAPKGLAINETIYPMIQLASSTDESYEPYTGGKPSPNPDYPQEIKRVVNPTFKVTNKDGLKVQSVTLNNITLNAIPVSSGGNVTIDGQQYIADYVDVEKGKLHRKVKRLNLKNVNSSDISHGFHSNGNGYLSINILNGNANGIAISNQYKSSSWTLENGRVYMPNNKSIVFVDNRFTDKPTAIGLIKDTYVIYELQAQVEEDLTSEQVEALKMLSTYYPVTNITVGSEELDGYTVFNYPISLANGWNYVKKQLNDNRDYIYDMDLQSAEAYVNSEYAVALTELEV